MQGSSFDRFGIFWTQGTGQHVCLNVFMYTPKYMNTSFLDSM